MAGTRAFLFLILILAFAAAAQAFPSEAKLKSKLRVGLTADEVVALFGEPNNGRVVPCRDCTFTYLPPLGTLTVNKEGYSGVRIQFAHAKVSGWHIYSSNPSYAEAKVPAEFRFFAWFFGITIALGIVSKFIIRRTPVAVYVSKELAKAFADREIETQKLPNEFRFITHETTLQGVIDKLGEPSRVVKIPISSETGLGYALESSKSGEARIVTYEYDLAYHAAVIVLPEFPFETQNRIRAVYYRPIQRELAEATD
jgi:hypothetical protein